MLNAAPFFLPAFGIDFITRVWSVHYMGFLCSNAAHNSHPCLQDVDRRKVVQCGVNRHCALIIAGCKSPQRGNVIDRHTGISSCVLSETQPSSARALNILCIRDGALLGSGKRSRGRGGCYPRHHSRCHCRCRRHRAALVSIV